jgi:hypothetical protein
MGGRPSTGPCDISAFEWLGFVAIVLAALAVVWITHQVARRGLGSNVQLARFVPIVTGGVAIMLTALVTLSVTQQIEKHAWPTVIVGPRGMDLADPFALGGAYGVEWVVVSGPAECHLDAGLHRADDSPYAEPLVSTIVPARTSTGSSTTYVSLDRSLYFIEADSDCVGWSITFTPRP